MNWLARIFAQALARRVAFLVVALLLAWCGVSEAHASCSQNTLTCGTRAEAYAQAGANTVNVSCAYGAPEIMVEGNNYPSGPTTGYTKWARCPTSSGGWNSWQRPLSSGNPIWGWSVTCSMPDETWYDPGKMCVSPDDCLAKNAEPGFKDAGPTIRPFSSRCVGGCEFKIQGGSVGVTGTDGITRYSGEFGFSGNTCGTELPNLTEQAAKEQKPQECVPLGGGQTVCVKKNGDHCYAASTGKQICWGVSETGSKNTDNVQQERNASTEAIPPNLNLPNGDTLVQQPPSTTTNTTVTNVSGGTSTTYVVTTTTTNYTTTNGTNPGTGDDGEPGDGTGGTSGDGEGNQNGSTGGGDCSAPPVNTGDPLLSQIAMQQWHTRCEASHRDSELRGEAGGLDTTQGEAGHENDLAKVWGDDTSEAPYQADESGFGFGNTCPAPPEIAGRSLDWAGLWELMGMGGLIVLAAAHMHALYIIAGD